MNEATAGREPLAHSDQPLPVGSIGTSSSGWWGAWFLLLSESSIFAYLFFAYFYYSIQPQAAWVPGPLPSFKYSGPQTAIMLIGCVTAWWSSRAARRGARLAVIIALAITLLLASGFIALEFADWYVKSFTFASSTYSGIYFTIGGLHLAHVVVGWFVFALLIVWSVLGYFDPLRHAPIIIGALYWYFIAGLWLAVFFVLNITPYLT